MSNKEQYRYRIMKNYGILVNYEGDAKKNLCAGTNRPGLDIQAMKTTRMGQMFPMSP